MVAPQSSNVKAIIASLLILLPLSIVGVLKYFPSGNRTHISTVAFPPTQVYGSPESSTIGQDVNRTLAEYLAGIQGLRVLSPSSEAVADALIITGITVDAGFVQLNIQIINPATGREIWNTPFQSPRHQLDEMLRVAGTALKHALERYR
jgi:hypothetical protein